MDTDQIRLMYEEYMRRREVTEEQDVPTEVVTQQEEKDQ